MVEDSNFIPFLMYIKKNRCFVRMKESKGAKIRNRYNQVPHMTQDTNGKVINSQQTPQTRAKRSALSQQMQILYFFMLSGLVRELSFAMVHKWTDGSPVTFLSW